MGKMIIVHIHIRFSTLQSYWDWFGWMNGVWLPTAGRSQSMTSRTRKKLLLSWKSLCRALMWVMTKSCLVVMSKSLFYRECTNFSIHFGWYQLMVNSWKTALVCWTIVNLLWYIPEFFSSLSGNITGTAGPKQKFWIYCDWPVVLATCTFTSWWREGNSVQPT